MSGDSIMIFPSRSIFLAFVLGVYFSRILEISTPPTRYQDSASVKTASTTIPISHEVLAVAKDSANEQPRPVQDDLSLKHVIRPIKAKTGIKQATAFTKKYQQSVLESLNLDDRQDFENAMRGRIAELPEQGVVRDSNGKIVWNLTERALAGIDQASPDTVHPSLWRQIQLLGISGLFQVCERVYQVRGLDLANITFIEGDSGLIVIDPLLSTETAKAALDLYYAHRPRRPVQTVIITHSHPDHFGGIAGVATPEELKEIAIIAPTSFLDEVFSENVLAGNAMQRRAGYMYGGLLPKSPTGDIGTGLGLGTSTGTSSLIKPTDSITKTGETRQLDGLTFEFQLTPGSEAPAEMHLYIHELRALCPAENATHTMHNLYTLRGAKIRDARAWANYLQESIDHFGYRTDVLFAPHHWPVWGQEPIVYHLTLQRDLYKFIHDQTLRLANRGLNMLEAAEQIQLPPELDRYWSNRGYYGCLNQNVKAVWNYYLGWFDGNPARLHPLPPADAGRRYVEYMGGIEQVVEKARTSFEQGEYRWVAQVLDHAVSANPEHVVARELLADTLEQLGYQSECGPWRNFYLTGAQELREGIQPRDMPSVDSSESIAALPLEAIFDSMAVRLNQDAAVNRKIAVNFQFTDTKQDYLLTLNNCVLNYFAHEQDSEPDCTVRLSRPTFDEILDGRASFVRKVFEGEARVTGSPRKLQIMFQAVEKLEPWFAIVIPQTAENQKNEVQ